MCIHSFFLILLPNKKKTNKRKEERKIFLGTFYPKISVWQECNLLTAHFRDAWGYWSHGTHKAAFSTEWKDWLHHNCPRHESSMMQDQLCVEESCIRHLLIMHWKCTFQNVHEISFTTNWICLILPYRIFYPHVFYNCITNGVL